MAAIEPETQRQAVDLLRAGKSVREAHAELERRGLKISRGAVGNLRQEALGAAEPPHAAAAARAVQDAQASAPSVPAPAAAPNYVEDLRQLYAKAMKVATSGSVDPRVALAASKQAAELLQQVRAMERESVDNGPRVVFYHPHELQLEHETG